MLQIQKYLHLVYIKNSYLHYTRQIDKISEDRQNKIGQAKNKMNNVFSTTIKELVTRNSFFQCFVCYEQFNSTDKFPMEVCKNQHFMCNQCVNDRAFKAKGNKYSCGLCITPIKLTEIKRSPFILGVKDFISNLIDRQANSRQRCNNFMKNQQKIIQTLMRQITAKSQEIQKLKNDCQRTRKQLRQSQLNQSKALEKQKQLENQKELDKQKERALGQQKEFEKQRSKQAQKAVMDENKNGFSNRSIFSGSIFRSSDKRKSEQHKQIQPPIKMEEVPIIKSEQNEQKVEKDKKPRNYMSDDLRILFQQAKIMRQDLEKDQQMSKSQLKKQLKQLQKHEKYLEKIAIQAIEEEQEFQQILAEIQKSEQIGKPRKIVHIDETDKKQQKRQKKQQKRQKW